MVTKIMYYKYNVNIFCILGILTSYSLQQSGDNKTLSK